VDFIAKSDPDMTEARKAQLNTMLLNAYAAWKGGRPVSPLLRSVHSFTAV
jgi:hypothetical protein